MYKVISREEYSENEDKNLHGRNARHIVEVFGSKKEIALIKEINNNHAESLSLSYEDQQIRDTITAKYWDSMQELWVILEKK